MAQDKTDKTDKRPSGFDGGAETDAGPSQKEIEEALDGVILEILADHKGKEALPGWHLAFPMGLKFIQIGKADCPVFSEEQAAKLVSLAESEPYAFDAASYVAGLNILIDHTPKALGIPNSLRKFAARVLTGEIKRPRKRGRDRFNDMPLKMNMYALCQMISQKGKIPLSRNRVSWREDKFSACDAVAEAFNRVDHHITYENLVSICYDKTYSELRDVAEALGLLDFSGFD